MPVCDFPLVKNTDLFSLALYLIYSGYVGDCFSLTSEQLSQRDK